MKFGKDTDKEDGAGATTVVMETEEIRRMTRVRQQRYTGSNLERTELSSG